MKISVKLGVSETRGHKTFSLEDLGLTEDVWERMDEVERHEAVEKAVFDLPEQPYWCVDTFNEIDK